jgi:small subunit ribosomal protein S18
MSGLYLEPAELKTELYDLPNAPAEPGFGVRPRNLIFEERGNTMSDQPVPAAPQAPSATPAPSAPRSEGHSGGGGHRSEGHSGGGAPRREGFSGGGGQRREGGGPGGPRRGGKRQYFRKKKVCRFCVERIDFIDYKKVEMLQPFVQERGKILPRRMTGTCSRHQRWLGEAIKRARNIALLPFATEL